MTKVRALHQWVPSFADKDAIGGHVLQVQRAITEDLGLRSEIYNVDARPGVARRSSHYRKAPVDASGETAIMYHLSIGSEMADVLEERPEPLVVDYHNVTPERYYDAWEPQAAYSAALGRKQLPQLGGRACLGLADSAFNEGDLVAAGYGVTGVVPILLDFGLFEHDRDEGLVDRLVSSGGSRWLFVSRLAPNKAQHDVIRAFAVYRRLFDGDAELDLVGTVSAPAYERVLRLMVDALGLGGVVHLRGAVSDSELGAFYSAADVYVCLSDHEGFGVPLLEAMFHELPVVAFGSSAVPETVGGGGLVLGDKSPLRVAVAVDRVLSDPVARKAMVAAGLSRLEDFELSRTRARLVEALTPVL